MGARGFLGTNASVLADMTLVLSLLVALTLTIGVVAALLKRYTLHRWIQTSAVSLNIVLVLAVMIGSFLRSAAPGLGDRIAEPYYTVAALHGLVGLVAFGFGTFVMLRGNELVPRALKFNNYKLFMRTAYGLYMAATAAGVWLYVTWYATPAQTAEVLPVAQNERELVVPMANFAFNPTEVIVPVGSTVIWTNQDGAPHNVVADDGELFSSELLNNGESFAFTFDQIGEFPYYCELHGAAGGVDMAGVVNVVPADEAPPLVAVAPPTAAPTVQPTPQPLPAQLFGQPIGTAAFRDNQRRSDRLVVDLALPQPLPAGQSLIAFLTTTDGSATLPLGVLEQNGDGVARLEYSVPEGESLAARYERLIVTSEAAATLPPAPAGQLVAEGRLPSQALPYLNELLVNGPQAPNQQGYAAGLRQQTEELRRHAEFAVNAQAAGDTEGMRRHAEHVYNLIAGSLDERFGDLNGDGRSQNPGDGFGLLPNGRQAGYIQATASAARAAAEVPEASEAIVIHAEHVLICTENMATWAAEARDLALALARTGESTAAAGQVEQLLRLAQQIERGRDINNDGQIAPISGEGGGLVAYEHAQFMAGYGLFPASQ